MKHPLPMTIVCVAGLVAGWMAGKQFGSDAAAPEDAVVVRRGPPDHAASRSSGNARQTKRDLASLMRIAPQRNWREAEMAPALGRLSVSELKDLMTTPKPSEEESASFFEDGLAIAVASMEAAKELYRREGVAALEWADTLEGPDERRRIFWSLIRAAASEHPEIAKPWIDRFVVEHGEQHFGTFASAAIGGATSRGADDLIRLWDLFEGQAILEHDLAGTFVGSIYRGIHTTQGEEVAAAWAAGAVSELPPEKRENAVGSLMSHPLSAEAVGALMDALRDQEHRRIVATESVFPHNRPPATAVAALERMPADDQVEILTAQAQTYLRSPPGPNADKLRGYFETVMERLDLPPEARTRVEAVLNPEAGGE